MVAVIGVSGRVQCVVVALGNILGVAAGCLTHPLQGSVHAYVKRDMYR
jgi:hypothetical protein